MSAWTVIAHTEVPSGGVASVTLTSVGTIPSTYTDLCVKISVRGEAANTMRYLLIRPNGIVNTNQSFRWLNGTGSTASSYADSSTALVAVNGGSSTSNTFSNVEVYIPNYAGSTAKSMSVDAVMEQNDTYAEQTILAGLWNDTAALTTIQFILNSGDIAEYSTFTLYGITKGSSGGVTVS